MIPNTFEASKIWNEDIIRAALAESGAKPSGPMAVGASSWNGPRGRAGALPEAWVVLFVPKVRL